jgi:hypothetical protein
LHAAGARRVAHWDVGHERTGLRGLGLCFNPLTPKHSRREREFVG